MNPILLYPQNPTQAKFFSDSAKSQGVEMFYLSDEVSHEDIEDWFLGAKMQQLSKTAKVISNDELDATFNRLIADK
jgi:hypothetical protein